MAALYFHIPFCKSRCSYCGFFSVTQLPLRDAYVDALCQEMHLTALPHGQTVGTIYMGGGTPSQLSVGQLSRLLTEAHNIYNVETEAEITIECNPDDVTSSQQLCRFLATGINGRPLRVSMGAQTFSDERLRQIGRRHTAQQVRQAVDMLRMAGVENISLDLMYGFPGENVELWRQDIEEALRLRPEHLSAYCLSYEEGTPMWRQMKEGKISETDEETERQMYYQLVDMLSEVGYEHYEISNFALPGRRSRHNSSYWNDTPYIGLGAGAHEYDGRERRWNVADLNTYLHSISQGNRPQEGETIGPDTRYDEAVMLRLRTCEGLPLGILTPEQRDYCLSQARPFISQQLLRRDADRLVLTHQGLFVSDMIISQLMIG